MKSQLLCLLLFVTTLSYAQVGIGTTTPKAFFNIPAGRTVLFGNDTSGTVSLSLERTPKLIWYSSKGAFRVGVVSTAEKYYSVWDNSSVGLYSFAAGWDTQASGPTSTAHGVQTVASGSTSTAIGNRTVASGDISVAMGHQTTASVFASTAMGISTSASGHGSVSMGNETAASGTYSVAMGERTVASGKNAVSTGYSTTATNNNATAMGEQTEARGLAATAMGSQTKASQPYSVAMGNQTTASGNSAVAMGFQTESKGSFSLAAGMFSLAAGTPSLAVGLSATATGANSYAIGASVSTNNQGGSFIFGDANYIRSVYQNTAPDQMMMRFAGGYTLYTSTPNSQTNAIGVQLPAGANSWTTISDSTRKENFRFADGSSFLQKIARLRLGSWNYKGQDAWLYRHYGPMAQDFFVAFGHDGIGTIGEDKSINQADFDGVNLIAIQALIKEVNQLKAELSAAKEREQTTQARLDKIEALLQDHASQATLIRKP